MKKFFKYLSCLFLTICLSLGLTSCSNDDSEDNANQGNGEITDNDSNNQTDDNQTIKAMTVKEALDQAVKNGEDAGSTRYTVEGTFSGILNAQYGNFNLEDSTGKIFVYGSNYNDLTEKPNKGDKIQISTLLHSHDGKGEAKTAEITKVFPATPGTGGNDNNDNNGNNDNKDVMTIKEALAQAKQNGEDAGSTRYTIEGTFSGILNAQYGNFNLEDSTGKIFVYGSNYNDLTEKPNKGDKIQVSVLLHSHKGQGEAKSGEIIKILPSAPNAGGNDNNDNTNEAITIAEAIAICKANGNNEGTTRYTITAKVNKIEDAKYGSFTIKDETGTLLIWNSTNFKEKTPKVGDTVTITTLLKEFKQGKKTVCEGLKATIITIA